MSDTLNLCLLDVTNQCDVNSKSESAQDEEQQPLSCSVLAVSAPSIETTEPRTKRPFNTLHSASLLISNDKGVTDEQELQSCSTMNEYGDDQLAIVKMTQLDDDEQIQSPSLRLTSYDAVIDTTYKRRRVDEPQKQESHVNHPSLALPSPPTTSSPSSSSSSTPSPPPSASTVVPLSSDTTPSSPALQHGDNKDDDGQTKQALTLSSKICLECKATTTPTWRNGPDGKKTLCNSCGLRYSKFLHGKLAGWQLDEATYAKRRTWVKRPTTDDDKSATASKKAESGSNISPAKAKKDTKKEDTLRGKKVFLKAGIYSGSTHRRQQLQQNNNLERPFKFSLPIHQGSILLNMEGNFELPADVREDYESGRLYAWAEYESTKKPPRFIRILHNSYVERKPRKEDQATVCQCQPPKEGLGCGEDCLNRMMLIECDPATCPSESLCSNQRFKKREFIKDLEIYLTNGRGWGLRTKRAIQQGTLITEYRGEVISDKTCQERIRTVYKYQRNFYFLDYHKGEVIDACTKGSEARFINHGCDPNCHIEKWSRGGEYHLGVFASKDIEPNTELFYDYNFSLFDTEAIGQECCCQSEKCRGFLGKRPSGRK